MLIFVPGLKMQPNRPGGFRVNLKAKLKWNKSTLTPLKEQAITVKLQYLMRMNITRKSTGRKGVGKDFRLR